MRGQDVLRTPRIPPDVVLIDIDNPTRDVPKETTRASGRWNGRWRCSTNCYARLASPRGRIVNLSMIPVVLMVFVRVCFEVMPGSARARGPARCRVRASGCTLIISLNLLIKNIYWRIVYGRRKRGPNEDPAVRKSRPF